MPADGPLHMLISLVLLLLAQQKYLNKSLNLLRNTVCTQAPECFYSLT